MGTDTRDFTALNSGLAKMLRKTEILRSVLTGKISFRIFLWILLDKIHFIRKTGNKRYQFERMYLENPDPWQYKTKTYEQEKYKNAINFISEEDFHRGSVLEFGCSIGLFSALLADLFDSVTSIDVSSEAIRIAKVNTRDFQNISYHRCGIEDIDIGGVFDVIVCSEILLYINHNDIHIVCDKLSKLLKKDGILVIVHGGPAYEISAFYKSTYILAILSKFSIIRENLCHDERWPYRILALRCR